MSSEIKTDKAPLTEADINKEAYSDLSKCVKQHLAEAQGSENPSKKAIRRLTEIQDLLPPVRDFLRYRAQRIIELNRSNKELQAKVLELEEKIEDGPVRNVFEIRRMPSAFSGVMSADDGIMDQFFTDCDPAAVTTRIRPIAAPEAGVVGLKVFVTDVFAHVIMFTELIGVIELREERKLNIDADSADALRVYLEGMTLAIGIADQYTKLYGAYSALPMTDNRNIESASIPNSMVVGESLSQVQGITGESQEDQEDLEEESDESDDDGDDVGDEDSEPSQEEILRRLDSEN